MSSEARTQEWIVTMSKVAQKSANLFAEEIASWMPNPDKNQISLATGDPLLHGNLKPSPELTDAVIQTIHDGKHNGYAPSVGYEEARAAVADFLYDDDVEIEAKDVILCSGCSSALDIAITVLADGSKNHNILIPRPGYPLYSVFAESLGVEVRRYDLLPENNWEVDLYNLETRIDSNTAAVVINNPSNPCGVLYTPAHLREILEVCHRYKVPVIADELHGQIIFPEHKYTSIASLASRVPVLICGGIAQAFLVPGWRIGWIIVHDPVGAFEQVRKGVNSLSQRIIGCNTVIQGSLMNILHYTSHTHNEDLVNGLGENARIVCDEVAKIRGLKSMMPQATIFMMIKVELEVFRFVNTMQFAKGLCEEEAVLCLPSECFGMPGYIRIVLCAPTSLIQEAVTRIGAFCQRHYV